MLVVPESCHQPQKRRFTAAGGSYQRSECPCRCFKAHAMDHVGIRCIVEGNAVKRIAVAVGDFVCAGRVGHRHHLVQPLTGESHAPQR